MHFFCIREYNDKNRGGYILTIFIDAGHGGTNPGAVNTYGLKEAEINLDVALRLGRILESKGYNVVYSRTDNTTLSLTDRSYAANNVGADYFVSIHCNSNVNPEINGTETFYYKENTIAQDFAIVVNNALVAEIGTKNLGTFSANFSVLRRTKMPAILVELAFISNIYEAEQLSTPSFREKCAIGIANGIVEFTS
jgi:N-acetylmuramoyl-L-alanine amidase